MKMMKVGLAADRGRNLCDDRDVPLLVSTDVVTWSASVVSEEARSRNAQY